MDMLAPLFFFFSVQLGPVAVVSNSDFAIGQQWRWNYSDAAGKPYSSEQYEVVENKDGLITIEMSSHFPGEIIFKPHHRIQAQLEDCLRTYIDAAMKKYWHMRMFYLEAGVWKETEPPSTLAFEEKFNCNPYQYNSREYLTVFDDSPRGKLFSQRRWRTLDASWFMSSGANAGVMYKKDFPHSAGGETYHVTFDSSSQLEQKHFRSY